MVDAGRGEKVRCKGSKCDGGGRSNLYAWVGAQRASATDLGAKCAPVVLTFSSGGCDAMLAVHSPSDWAIID
jgi:hypothetical protein